MLFEQFAKIQYFMVIASNKELKAKLLFVLAKNSI